MTTKQSVLDLLKQQKELERRASPEDPKKRKDEWLDATKKLMRQLFVWLEEARTQELLRVEKFSDSVEEEYLGKYRVQALKVLAPNHRTITIRPKARDVVGSLGRVDFDCAPKKAILVRTAPDHWQFAVLAAQNGGYQFQDLTEESFWETMRNLLS